MTFGSLFAGIGGFDLGLERAGMTCKWQVEIDPFCRAVLAKHWPDVRRYKDVRDVGAHNLEPVDVLCGGFPCQDISAANPDGQGLAGARSGLWSEYARLVRELRPDYVLVENVAALLGRGLGQVVGDLAESGYDAEWDCLPASAFGAPHQRDRLWIVAYPNGLRELQPQGGEQDERRRAGNGSALQNAERIRRGEVEQPVSGGAHRQGTASASLSSTRGWWAVEPELGRVAHGIPNRAHRLRGLGNAIVPQIAEWLGRRVMEHSA